MSVELGDESGRLLDSPEPVDVLGKEESVSIGLVCASVGTVLELTEDEEVSEETGLDGPEVVVE